MKTRLLQVIFNQKPVGFLGFEAGLYRFHYLQEFGEEHAISPLMPTRRMFYESERLFPVFAQFIEEQACGYDNLLLLETQGHMSLGHLSFVNPSRPKVLPRVTFDRSTLTSFKNWVSLNEALVAKSSTRTELSGNGYWGFCIHTKPGARYPNQIICPNKPENRKGKLKDLLEEADRHRLRTPHYEVLTESDSILMERPNLNALGHKLPMHSLASLMGLSKEQAQTIFEQSKDNKNTLQAAVRVLRLFKQPTEVMNAIMKAGDFFDEINPLTHLWLIGGQLKFMP